MDPLPLDTVSTGILLASVNTLATPHHLSSVIQTATSLTRDKLIIVLFSRSFNVKHGGSTYPESLAISHTATSSWKDVQRMLTYVYVQATKAAQEKDKVLMEIDVLLKGLNEADLEQDLDTLTRENHVDIVFRVSGDSIATPLPASIGSLRTSYLPSGNHLPDLPVAEGSYASLAGTPMAPPTPSISRTATSANVLNDVTVLPAMSSVPSLSSASGKPPFYPVVALGGTFDHLHPGHKILLSMGAWIASEKLIVGVTSDSLLSNKPNAHLVEPLEVRMQNVRNFLNTFKKGLDYYITELKDVYGPTGYDPNVQALVVSRETVPGATQIATHRAAHNLCALDLYVIDVISATNHNLDHEDVGWLKDAKLSSTFIRSWIAEKNAKQAAQGDSNESKN